MTLRAATKQSASSQTYSYAFPSSAMAAFLDACDCMIGLPSLWLFVGEPWTPPTERRCW